MKPLPDNWLAPFEPLPQLSESMEQSYPAVCNICGRKATLTIKQFAHWVTDHNCASQPESMEPGSLFGKEADRLFEHAPATDELRDAYINDYDPDGSGQ